MTDAHKPHHLSIIQKLDWFLFSNKIPHIILHGTAGSGKRTVMYDFLNKIYGNDKQKLKTNVMIVNCAHCKGIKFIREELKFFAKSNMQANNGKLFKSIVLLNADSLTIDAQSALRRCIELFSHTTRFFLVVENKDKLLNPICSRFCEIYIPEILVNRQIPLVESTVIPRNIMDRIIGLYRDVKGSEPHIQLIEITEQLYNGGYSALDIIKQLRVEKSVWSDLEIANTTMHFEQVKSEYRSEKLLMFYILNYMFYPPTNNNPR